MAKELLKLKEELRAEFKQELAKYKDMIERDLRTEIRELRTEQRNMTNSIEFAHQTIQELKQKLSTALSVNVEQEKQNELLRAKCTALESRGADMERRLLLAEQYSRNVNLEIQGVARKENESVPHILSMIGSAINEQITEADIESCHRVPTRNPERSNIVVQFKSRAKRDATLRKAKKARLTNKDVGLDISTPIYINEHLCPTLKRLLGMAIRRKHECNWKSVWTANGKIFARQSELSAVIQIHDESSLSKITTSS
nr:uncharacterized protein LOC119187331 [Rhipicephalus microplus]